jgi:hypothetical protein
MVQDDDPHAPYKVYEGDELKGTYATRAEARRRQQQLESQAAGTQSHFIPSRTSSAESSFDWAGSLHAAQAAGPVGVGFAVRVAGRGEQQRERRI